MELRHARGRIGDVAEHDRLRRTGLLAGGDDFIDARDLCPPDPLDTVGTFLHDSARAHGDVGIEVERLDFRYIPVEVEPVEAPYFVGTVVGAEARSDAAVVDHLVETVGAVDGRVHGTDVLAGRLFAVLAEHRLMHDAAVDVIAIEPEPVHLAALLDVDLADDRYVVLRLAGDDAGIATDA